MPSRSEVAVIKSYGLGRFEFLVVTTVMSIILSVAIARYMALTQEARILSFELMSHHFMTAAVNARTQWLLQVIGGDKSSSQVIGLTTGVGSLYFTAQGWPLSESQDRAVAGEPNLDDCHRLWVLLLQPSEPISMQGSAAFASQKYHLSLIPNGCRYFLAADSEAHYYFDYLPQAGRVVVSASMRRKHR
jgi:type II secretory pathway pseudopilin PulG